MAALCGRRPLIRQGVGYAGRKEVAMRIALRTLSCALVLVVLSVSPASSGPRDPGYRVIVKEYTAPHSVRTTHWDDQLKMLPERPPIVFTPRPVDRFVKFDLDDMRDSDVFIWIKQPGPGDDLHTAFCGSTGVFELVSSEPIEVRVYSGLCVNHLFPIATAGEIKATFSPVNWGRGISRGRHHH